MTTSEKQEMQDTREKQEKRKVFRVPSNRYLRHQHTKLGYGAIFIFFIDGQAYGLESAKVKNNLPSTNLIKVADLPEQIIGIVEHKSFMVPVINLRAHLNLNNTQTGSEAHIIVLKINQQLVGMQVDSIADPVFAKDIKILYTPANNVAIDSQFLLGVAKTRDCEIVLLDIEKLLEKNNVLSQALNQVQAISLNKIVDLETKI